MTTDMPLGKNESAARPAHNNRRAPRIARRMDVTLHFPDRQQRFQTRDISYIGVFIECPDPLPLRKLVRFQMQPEGHEEPIRLLGLVAHRINAADAVESGRPTGMGLQLFGISQEMREAWRGFVLSEYEKDPEALREVESIELPRLKLRFPNTDEMRTFASQHVSKGEVFIRSADLYPQGSRIWVEAIHPGSGKSLDVEATVSEFIEAPRNHRGMKLRFADPQGASEQLTAFSNER